MLQIYLHPFQLKPGHFTVKAEATGGISEWDFRVGFSVPQYKNNSETHSKSGDSVKKITQLWEHVQYLA